MVHEHYLFWLSLVTVAIICDKKMIIVKWRCTDEEKLCWFHWKSLYDFVSDLCSIAHTKSKNLKRGMTKRKFLKSLHVKLAKVRYRSV